MGSRTSWRNGVGVFLLALLAFVGLGSWALASPVGAAPDDDYHLASIWCGLGERDGLCEPGQSTDSRTVQDALVSSASCYAFDSQASAACGLSESRYVDSNRGNFVGSYPPVFYGTMGLFASTNVALSTIIMRLVNAALFVAVVTFLAVSLKRGQRGPLLWGVTLAAVPLGMFLIPSVNPSSWAVLSGATLWITMYSYFRSEKWRSRITFAALSLVLTIMGAGARGDAAAYAALSAVIVMVLTFENRRKWYKQAVLPVGIILIGALFFLSSGQSTGVTGISDEAPVAELSIGAMLGGIYRNIMEIQSLWIGNLGYWGLGWLDTPLPPIVWVTTTVLFGAVAFWGLRIMNLRKAISLILVVTAMLFVPMFVLVREQLIVGQGVQPRYVLPLMFMFAGISVIGLNRDSLGLTWFQTTLVFLGLAIANSRALFVNLRRYITGTDVGGPNLNSNIEWWWSVPFSPMTVWFVGSAAFALMLLGLMFVLHEYRPKWKRGNPVANAKIAGAVSV